MFLLSLLTLMMSTTSGAVFLRVFSTNTPLLAENGSTKKIYNNSELANLYKWLIVNKLSLNIAKTQLLTIGSHQRLANNADHSLNMHLGDQVIKTVCDTKSLGSHICHDRNVNEIARTIFSGISSHKGLGRTSV